LDILNTLPSSLHANISLFKNKARGLKLVKEKSSYRKASLASFHFQAISESLADNFR